MTDLTIEVSQREQLGKNANRRARTRGKIPAVVYGGGKDPVAIEVDRKSFVDQMKGHKGENPLFLLKLDGKERHAMIRTMQTDPISREVIHIDFQRVLMDQKVRVAVPVELVGTAFGVKTEGGMLDFVTRELHVECLPGDIPKHLEFDVTNLHVGQHVEAGQVELPKGVTLLDEAEKVIASLGHARSETPEGEGGDRAEPELIKKGKPEA